MSLSPLYLSLSTNLHVRTDSVLHHRFRWLRPARVKITIFRVTPPQLILKSFTEALDRSKMSPLQVSLHIYVHFADGFATQELAVVRNSLARVSRRDVKKDFVALSKLND
jgi:hypothetical protein